MDNPVITIAIPAYNNERHISYAIESAMNQNYPLKEILVIDDCSSDKTFKVANSFEKVRVIRNSENLGIGLNLNKLMREAEGKYIVYLSADDIFADPNVVSDIVQVFNKCQDIGVVGRYYYYFMDGKEGAIGVCRESNILISSCCPSGMAFRVDKDVNWTNNIFIEMPYMVSQYIRKWRWTMLEYDTFGSRFHPSEKDGNTGTKKSYYKESPTQNWINLLGQNYQDFPMFITLKNRAPHLLWNEICLHVRNNNKVLFNKYFWFNAIIALVVPSFILRRITIFYRDKVGRISAKIIRRE